MVIDFPLSFPKQQQTILNIFSKVVKVTGSFNVITPLLLCILFIVHTICRLLQSQCSLWSRCEGQIL